MDFEIDVSGEDIFNEGYTIVIASDNGIIKGFKFNESIIRVIRSREGEGRYRYPLSKQGRSLLRVRLYSIVVYYLFKSLKVSKKDLDLKICKDFQGHEKDITSSLKPLLEKLGFNVNKPKYLKLPRGSIADKYAYLMRKDTKNKMKGYVKITLEELEKFLKKRR